MIVELSVGALGYGIYKYCFPNQRTKIKRLFQKMFIEKNLKNSKGYHPIIKEICIKDYGAIAKVDIKGVCSFQELQKHEDYLKTLFGALDVNVSYKCESVEVQLILNELHDIEYQKIHLQEHQLLLGHDFKGTPIIADMQKVPHLLITGLPSQGKTYMTKTIIKNLDTTVIMFNGFKDDYKDLNNIIHVQSEEDILKRLESIYSNKTYRKKPLYLFFEELSTIKNKKIIQLLKEILCVGRHYNIYVIGIIQISTKEELQCKSYFTTRVSFKQVDSSSYAVALGVTVNETLNKREFYLLSDGLHRGKTYNLIEKDNLDL